MNFRMIGTEQIYFGSACHFLCLETIDFNFCFHNKTCSVTPNSSLHSIKDRSLGCGPLHQRQHSKTKVGNWSETKLIKAFFRVEFSYAAV